MNDTNSPPSDNDFAAIAENQGFAAETSAPTTPPAASAAARRKADADVKRRNLMATFGSGPGKLALIAVAVVVVVFGVLGVSNLRNPPTVVSKAQVDAPTSPQNRVTNTTVTSEEAARRSEQSRKEAEAAHNAGGSYQPGFDYNIGDANKPQRPEATAKFSGFETPDEESARAQAANGNARTMQPQGQASATQAQQLTAQQQAEQQRREQEVQRHADKLATEEKTAEGARDKYVESVSEEIVKQIGGMFSSQGGDSLNNLGSYSQTTYYPAQAKDSAAADRVLAANQRVVARKAIIKAGSTAYATLDSEANTDDGRTVLATVRGGKWKGAKLIGQIEQANNNMSLTFTTMAPQDERSTMRVRAVALREADAKLGMADKIDHHTLSRYSALAAAALLQGAGRVYQQPVGTTVATNGGIVTTTEAPGNRQVIGSAVGEMGMAIGSEIRRRGFNQSSTYSTPAETGFILYFLEDVLPQAGDEQQQPQQQPQQNTQVNPVNAANVVYPGSPFPQGGAATPGYNPGYGSAPSGYNPGYGSAPSGYSSGGYGSNQYPGGGFDNNRYRGPLNSNQ